MNPSAVSEMISQFEKGTYPKEKWNHHTHFVMALWYTYHESIHIARHKIKEGIKKYNISVGGENTDDSGYHETITEFYIHIIVSYQLSFTTEYDFELLLKELDRQQFLDKNYPFRFFSKEKLMSKRARKQWVVPDRQYLPVLVGTPVVSN